MACLILARPFSASTPTSAACFHTALMQIGHGPSAEQVEFHHQRPSLGGRAGFAHHGPAEAFVWTVEAWDPVSVSRQEPGTKLPKSG